MLNTNEEANNIKVENKIVPASSLKSSIKKVCVIGAGVMGSGIAAIIANSSIEVVLLDIPSVGSENKNEITRKAIEKTLNQPPPAFTHPNKAQYITIGNLEDDLTLITQCDLIIEVIIEKVEIKHELYQKILPFLKESAILASNTSTLRLKQLKENLPSKLKSRFLITHFFNPPRYMELLELVSDYETDQHVIEIVSEFIHKNLGKTIVKCNDTPGFIANRIGCFLLELVVRRGLELDINPHIIDQIFIKFLNLPSTGIFGLYDLIGHDVMKLISSSLIKNLPNNDLYHNIYKNSPLLDKMIEEGYIGRKGKGGFYRISQINGKKIKEVLSISSSISSFAKSSISNDDSFSYIPIEKNEEVLEAYPSLAAILSSDTIYGSFLNEVLGIFYIYLFYLIPTVSENITDIDVAMKLGYSWKYGPFELFQKFLPNSYDWLINQSQNRKLLLPTYFNKNFIENINKSDLNYKRYNLAEANVLLSNKGAILYNYNNSLVFSISTKLNCLNSDIFNLMLQAIDFAEENNKNLYIYSPSQHFCAGADLKHIVSLIENQDFKAIEDFIKLGQKVMTRMKYSNANIISCAQGVALGGGCEILLHSSYIIAHSELKAGLVEVGVGLIPGWGGMKEMFMRSAGDKVILIKNLSNILNSNKTTSVDYFALDYNLKNINIVMNKEYLFEEALNLNFKKDINPYNKTLSLPQLNLSEEFNVDSFNQFQFEILSLFQEIINLKKVTEQELLDFERENFLKFCKNPDTLLKLKNV